jgi:formylmethanofuran dehydrogenase subunit E
MTILWKLLRDFSGQETGLECRRCREAIPARDMLGVSERVCSPCRNESDTSAGRSSGH